MYKTQQVLRLGTPQKAEDGTQLSSGTRVVVMSTPNGKVRAKVVDPNLPGYRGRVELSPGAFKTTHRGRPRKA